MAKQNVVEHKGLRFEVGDPGKRANHYIRRASRQTRAERLLSRAIARTAKPEKPKYEYGWAEWR